MRLRAVQLACMVLLLSSLSAARGTTLRSGEFGLGGHYISALLGQERAASDADATYAALLTGDSASGVPATAVAHARIAWTVRPSVAQSSAVHAVTGSSL